MARTTPLSPRPHPGPAMITPARAPVQVGVTPSSGVDQRVRTQVERMHALLRGTEKLNFGCGDMPLTGWCNLDNGDGVWYRPPEHPEIVQLDVFEALHALPRECARFVTSEHFFEHFSLAEGRQILRGWLLALRPGGVVRIVTPDLQIEARIYLEGRAPVDREVYLAHKRRWLNTRHAPLQGEELNDCILLNYGVRLDGHKFIYDFPTLAQELRLAGFTNIQRCSYGQSTHPELRGIDHHDGGETGRSFVPGLALVVEATRPERVGDGSGELGRRLLDAAELSLARTPRCCAPEIDPATRAAMDELAALRRERAAMRARLVEAVAERCAAEGFRNIALYGAGRHTRAIVREPWLSKGVRVACVLDDHPTCESIDGVPVFRPQVKSGAGACAERLPAFDAVVVSSDAHEATLHARASTLFERKHIPVIEIYGRALSGLKLGE